jgi:hypothetical protein
MKMRTILLTILLALPFSAQATRTPAVPIKGAQPILVKAYPFAPIWWRWLGSRR